MLKRTKIGLAFRAVASNRESAQLVGIGVGRTLMIGWGLAAALGAFAGSLRAASTPTFDTNLMLPVLIYSFAAVTLGGFDSLGGAVLGGLDRRGLRNDGRRLRRTDRWPARAGDRARDDHPRVVGAAVGSVRQPQDRASVMPVKPILSLEQGTVAVSRVPARRLGGVRRLRDLAAVRRERRRMSVSSATRWRSRSP